MDEERISQPEYKLGSDETTVQDLNQFKTEFSLAPEFDNTIDQVWQEKQRLFKSLSAEERNKIRFHVGDENDDHTNRVVSLLCRALIGAKNLERDISPEKASQAVMEAIAHDWGYARENGAVTVDLSTGHEERSIAMFRKFLQDKGIAEAEKFGEMIDHTKYGTTVPDNMEPKESTEYLVRFADLCAGVSFESWELYKERMQDLYDEPVLNNQPNPFKNSSDLMTRRDPNNNLTFIQKAAEKLQPFLKLLDNYYHPNNPVKLNIVNNMNETLKLAKNE